MKKIELEIVALSSSVTRNQYYAVVLGELNGVRRLPIVIGAFEAQAIVVALEKIQPTRPLTHDLFYNFILAFHIELEEVLIHKLEEGVFYARLYCRSGNKTIEIDSRTSDALALAIRIGCPIFIYEKILKTAGLIMDTPSGKAPSADPEKAENLMSVQDTEEKTEDLSKKTMAELKQMLREVLEKEEYMKAVSIRDEIQKREG